MIYPGNLIDHEVTFKYIHLVHCPITILIFVCIGKIYYVYFLFLLTWFINLLFYVGRYKIHCIIDFYEEKVYCSGKIDGSTTLLVFKILFSIIDFCLFVLFIIKIYNRIKELKQNNEENRVFLNFGESDMENNVIN